MVHVADLVILVDVVPRSYSPGMQRAVCLAARFILALGILLNGVSMSLAGEPHSPVAHMNIMPGMHMESSRKAPGKQAPCCGMDCGSCIAGSCAAPVLVQAELDVQPIWFSVKTNHEGAVLRGVVFPPDIRPPISHGIAA